MSEETFVAVLVKSFVPLLASLGVSLNMPLSRVMCVTH